LIVRAKVNEPGRTGGSRLGPEPIGIKFAGGIAVAGRCSDETAMRGNSQVTATRRIAWVQGSWITLLIVGQKGAGIVSEVGALGECGCPK
jgi:hypothetical protein